MLLFRESNMWHILKTELHYHKGFFLVIGIPLVILAFAWADGVLARGL